MSKRIICMAAITNFARKALGNYLVKHDPNGKFYKEYTNLFYENRRKKINTDLASFKECVDLFEDSFSKEQYERELYFLCFHSNMGELLSPCSPMVWERACAKAEYLLKNGDIARLQTENNDEVSVTASTIVLEQYEYSPVVSISPGDIFIDVGGYIGDTAYWAHRKGARKIYSFEPNPQSIALIENNKKKFNGENVEVVPLGLANAKGQATFNLSDHSAGARIIKDREASNKRVLTIKTTDLDSWCKENNVRPDFIKMDIEGGEVNALEGAMETIKTSKPKLAISLYHKMEHMTLIPRMIHELGVGYRFWCKKARPDAEFILFASTGSA